MRAHPYTPVQDHIREPIGGLARKSVVTRSILQPSVLHDSNPPLPPAIPLSSSSSFLVDHESHYACSKRQTLINDDVRARITAALSSLKRKRGAPFSFVTEVNASFIVGGNGQHIGDCSQQRSSASAQCAEPSLKLSNPLRPLNGERRRQSTLGGNYQNENSNNGDQRLILTAKMPSYLSF